jgi:hypothetical protein
VVVDSTLTPTRYRVLEPVREFTFQLLRARGAPQLLRAARRAIASRDPRLACA